MNSAQNEYLYSTGDASHTHAYLWDPVVRELQIRSIQRVFDLGCGNGALARHLARSSFDVSGVDPSSSGITEAQKSSPQLRLEVGDAYEDLSARFGRFQAVVSLEVVEHVYAPRKYAATVADLLEPGGIALISTPYHGYWKNLALAIAGAMDHHYSPLWDHGHIKFWSVPTLTRLMEEAGLTVMTVRRLGRIPPVAKSMLLVARKPPVAAESASDE